MTASLLDQFAEDSEPLLTIKEEEKKEEAPKAKRKKKEKSSEGSKSNEEENMEIDEKREQLSILAVMGTIEDYTGEEMSLGDIKKLSQKKVEKYYNRYQVASYGKPSH